MKVYLIVHGFVQNVGYRYFVKRIALKYDLRGMVKNLHDGSVCIFAEGSDADIESFEEEINADFKSGPQVHNIERFVEGDKGFPKTVKDYTEFKIEKD